MMRRIALVALIGAVVSLQGCGQQSTSSVAARSVTKAREGFEKVAGWFRALDEQGTRELLDQEVAELDGQIRTIEGMLAGMEGRNPSLVANIKQSLAELVQERQLLFLARREDLAAKQQQVLADFARRKRGILDKQNTMLMSLLKEEVGLQSNFSRNSADLAAAFADRVASGFLAAVNNLDLEKAKSYFSVAAQGELTNSRLARLREILTLPSPSSVASLQHKHLPGGGVMILLPCRDGGLSRMILQADVDGRLVIDDLSVSLSL